MIFNTLFDLSNGCRRPDQLRTRFRRNDYPRKFCGSQLGWSLFYSQHFSKRKRRRREQLQPVIESHSGYRQRELDWHRHHGKPRPEGWHPSLQRSTRQLGRKLGLIFGAEFHVLPNQSGIESSEHAVSERSERRRSRLLRRQHSLPRAAGHRRKNTIFMGNARQH